MNTACATTFCLLSLLTAGGALLGTAGCARDRASAEADGPSVTGDRVSFAAGSPARAAVVVVAAAPPGPEVRRLAGRIAWDEDATVRVYAPVAGRVLAVTAALGATLEREAPLARLDSPDYGQAQADARKAGADLLLASRQLARARDLFEHGATARKDLEAAEDAEAAARFEQERTNARLKLYGGTEGEVDGLFTLRSPLAGTVVERNVNPGQEVRPDQALANAPQIVAPLFVVSDPAHFRLLLDAPEGELSWLHPGMAVTVRAAALPGRAFGGRIDGIADSLDPTTHMATVRGQVDNPMRLLKAEMFVTAEFTLAPASGADVPATAVFLQGDRHFVYVEEAPGTYARRPVEVAAEHEGRMHLRAGVAANERIVSEGALLLEEVRKNSRAAE